MSLCVSSILIGACSDDNLSRDLSRQNADDTVDELQSASDSVGFHERSHTGGESHSILDQTADSNLIAIDYAQWQTVRTAVQPDILVVDLWASWCIPCLERFPHMVELSEKYADHGVRFLSLSLDDREDQASIDFANQFLSQQRARFKHYLLDENILDGFEKLDLQTVPAVDIYHRNGELALRLTGDNPNEQFTEQDIEHALQTMIN